MSAAQVRVGCCRDGGAAPARGGKGTPARIHSRDGRRRSAVRRTGCGGSHGRGEAGVGEEKVVDSHVRAFEVALEESEAYMYSALSR